MPCHVGSPICSRPQHCIVSVCYTKPSFAMWLIVSPKNIRSTLPFFSSVNSFPFILSPHFHYFIIIRHHILLFLCVINALHISFLGWVALSTPQPYIIHLNRVETKRRTENNKEWTTKSNIHTYEWLKRGAPQTLAKDFKYTVWWWVLNASFDTQLL